MQYIKVPSLALVLIILFLLFKNIVSAQQNPKYSAEVEARIKQVERSLGELIKTDDGPIILQERMKAYNVPGVSIAVIKDFKIDWARGYGFADKERSKGVTARTLFQAASISKSLNAVGVLKLVQDNRVNLDADINTCLSSWKFPYDSTKGNNIITLRNLLSHTGGTSVHGFRGYAIGEEIPDIVQILNGETPANNLPVQSMLDAGTTHLYSGGGTSISQLIVMDITRQPYDQWVQKNVLAPLGMKNSFYTTLPPARKAKLLATGYQLDGKPIQGRYHFYPEQAAASLWTNPTELGNFIIEMQLAYAGRSNKVLGQELVTTMLTPVLKDAALGVFIKTVGNDKYFSHSGANEGFSCIYVGSVEGGNGVVVMVNSDNGSIVDEIVNSVATVYEWKDFYQPVILTLAQVQDEVLDTYVGEYAFNPQVKIVIRREGHSLKGQATGQPEFDLFAEDQNKFFLKVAEAKIEFIKDDLNKVTHLILHQRGLAIPATKVR
jgi:CubicO group peptidase (beta-lactamase class C family)